MRLTKKLLLISSALLLSVIMPGCSNTNNSENTNINTNTEKQDKEVTTYSIRFVTNGGTLPKGYKTNVVVPAMTTYKLPLPTKLGNSFDGWFLSEDDDAEQFLDNSQITSNLVLYARWSEVTYKITYKLNGGVNNSSNPTEFSISSQDIVLGEPTKENSVFLGWTSDDEDIPNKHYEIKQGTSSDKVVTANWYETYRIKNNGNLEEPDEDDTNYIAYNVLDLQKNNIFILAFYCIYENGYVKCEAECGTYKQEKNGVIRLMFNSSRQDEFVVHQNDRYIFTDVNGRPISEIGNEGVDIIVDNAVEPFIEGGDRYGYRSLNFFENSEELQKIYNVIWEKCEQVLNSNEDFESLAKMINLKKYGVSGNDFLKVFKVFLLDNPQYYFLSRTASIEANYAFLYIDDDYLKGNDRIQINTEIDLIIENCKKTFTVGESNLSRYLAIHDYVISLIDYAYADDGTPSNEVWAHNIVGATKGLGVCQTYGDLFDFLCLTFGLEDIQVSGSINQTGENHVWNLINVEDSYYAVDVTWDDLGEDGLTHSFFGLSYADINESRTASTPESEGIQYLYSLPKMSNENIQLVYLKKADVFLNVCKSIDDALSKINEPESEYTLELFYYGLASGPLLFSGPSISYTISLSEWPEAKKITIAGHKYDLGQGYIADSVLHFNQNTTFNSDIEFVNSTIGRKNVSLCFDGHTFTTSGYHCQIQANLISENGNYECKTSSQTTLYGKINVNECHSFKQCSFRDDVIINKLNYYATSRVDLLPYEYDNPIFNVGEINILEAKEYGSLTLFVSTNAYDHYVNPKNSVEKYSLSIGNINNCTDIPINFTIDQQSDYDDEFANISITGNLSDNLNLEIWYDTSRVIQITDASGNVIHTETLYCSLSSGQEVLYAPNIDSSKVEFSLLEDGYPVVFAVTKDEAGHFIKD